MSVDVDEVLHAHAKRVRTDCRLPSLVLAVGHKGRRSLVGDGLADVAAGVPSGRGDQYRIGSVTKTFTAALVLSLVERGLLELDRPVEGYLAGTAVGRPLVRQLLSHTGGVQREAPLPMWSTMQGPDQAQLRQSLAEAELIDRPGRRWHYSNLGYAILGQIVVEVTGETCEELIDREIFKPLGLRSTTWQPQENAATGYRLDPFMDVTHPEPVMDQGAIGVGGQLWSTGEDLLVWGAALSGEHPEVVSPFVVESMHTPQAMVDRRGWDQGWGLGLILNRHRGRIVSGHTGAMPGFLASLTVDKTSHTVVAALANVTRGVVLSEVTTNVLDQVLQDTGQRYGDDDMAGLGTRTSRSMPCDTSPGPSRSSDPGEIRGVLGRWWCESEETVFTWQEGHLHAHLLASPEMSATCFRGEGRDEFRAVAGRLEGERLRIVRSGDGKVASLEWATYPYTRDPR